MGRNSACVSGETEFDIFITLLTFLQIAVSEQEQMEALLTGMEKVVQFVSRYKLYEIVYLDSPQVEETNDTLRQAFVCLEEKFVNTYTAILKVLANACNTFGQSGIRRWLSSTLNRSLYVGLVNQLSSLDDDVIKYARICEDIFGGNCHKNMRQILRILRDLKQSIHHIDLGVSPGTPRRTQILQ